MQKWPCFSPQAGRSEARLGWFRSAAGLQSRLLRPCMLCAFGSNYLNLMIEFDHNPCRHACLLPTSVYCIVHACVYIIAWKDRSGSKGPPQHTWPGLTEEKSLPAWIHRHFRRRRTKDSLVPRRRRRRVGDGDDARMAMGDASVWSPAHLSVSQPAALPAVLPASHACAQHTAASITTALARAPVPAHQRLRSS
jgi:hypothetical protein